MAHAGRSAATSTVTHGVGDDLGPVPDVERERFGNRPPGLLELSSTVGVTAPIEHAAVVGLALHLEDEVVRPVGKVEPARPVVLAEVDLSLERTLTVLQQDLIDPRLEPALRWAHASGTVSRELAQELHTRATTTTEVVEHAVQAAVGAE